ncbi:nuclear nucleic acid-binding protein C1D isoform X2 [Latimeria chalumnae]|uniref:nuclear nucleic acid-binding protein C1D isoform X2 n=1 Tax=Latimeria chalumnae TaxID=7897 RepID=UPI0003C1692A|nr:PREDICTED: nuclear nucleic acid-binding protein C1D isoform X2 [Latimeria chalumnae]|eukprot:XP_006005192.1 PREDICTED: nuclear nucleic acid-binding protein C1D isoform X2 [Latimeria chalumnae]
MAEEAASMEDYPTEIHEYLSAFESSLSSTDEMLRSMMSLSRNELLQKLEPLEQAKLDLVSAYTLNSLFWIYLVTLGVNPKEHPVKQELGAHTLDIPLSGPSLQGKTLQFVWELKTEEFKTSNGWLESFQRRHNISEEHNSF